MRKLFGISVFGLLGTALIAVPSANTTLVSFTIDDTFPGAGAGVYSDTGAAGTNAYHDYRIDPTVPGPDDVDPTDDYRNWCVDAEPSAGGNLFVRLNRKLDGDAGVQRCTDYPRPDDALGAQRNFVLRIANVQACEILADPLAGLPLTDPQGNPWGAGSKMPCILAENDNPRIRLGTLYKPRAKTTNVDFLTVMFDAPNSYEIRSDAAAAIQTSAAFAGHKTVTYTGTFRLVKFEPGKKARAVGPSFAMPVKMDFYEQ